MEDKLSFLFPLQNYICYFESFILQINISLSFSKYIEIIFFGFCLILHYKLIAGKESFKLMLNFLINEYGIAYDLHRSVKKLFPSVTFNVFLQKGLV